LALYPERVVDVSWMTGFGTSSHTPACFFCTISSMIVLLLLHVYSDGGLTYFLETTGSLVFEHTSSAQVQHDEYLVREPLIGRLLWQKMIGRSFYMLYPVKTPKHVDKQH
jgi:hypothetical protein